MNGHCSTCDRKQDCHYPWKPTDCCDYRKFWTREQRAKWAAEQAKALRPTMSMDEWIRCGHTTD